MLLGELALIAGPRARPLRAPTSLIPAHRAQTDTSKLQLANEDVVGRLTVSALFKCWIFLGFKYRRIRDL